MTVISTCIRHETEEVLLPVQGDYPEPMYLPATRCKLCGGLFWIGFIEYEEPTVKAVGGDM